MSDTHVTENSGGWGGMGGGGWGGGVFLGNLANAKFCENKALVKWHNHCRLLMLVNHDLVVNF